MHWFYDSTFRPDQPQLNAAEVQHLKALRIRIGEQIVITNGQGLVANCRLTGLDPLLIEVEEFSQQAQATPRFHLIQALAKNDRDEMALQASVELGASSVTPWQADRSIVKWEQKAERNQARWQTIAVEAMKQSQQSFICQILQIANTRELRFEGVGLVLDPRSELTLEQIPPASDYTLAVGPEGGVSDSELATLHQAGFLGVRLGHSVLRASTAGPAAIAALQVLHGGFRS